MEIDPKQIVIHAIGFLILLAILKKFAWGAMLGAMEARSKRIAEDFAAIERAKQEIAKLKGEYQDSLARIEEQAQAKIQQAVAEGRRVASEIEESSRASAREALEKSKEAIALEVAKARVELKEQVVDLAIQATHKILQQNLDEETDRRMIEAFIKEINTVEKGNG